MGRDKAQRLLMEKAKELMDELSISFESALDLTKELFPALSAEAHG